MGVGGGVDLVADHGDGSAYAVVHGDVFVGAEHVLNGVIRVAVGGDEVDGDVVFGGVFEEVRHPLGGGCGGASDTEAGAYGF